jgi:O-antigen ligase
MFNLISEARLAKLTLVVLSTYLVFMLGFFFIPNAVDQYKFYSVAVFIPALALLPRMIRTLGYDRLLQLIVVYLLWMLLTSFWSETFSLEVFVKTLRLAAYIIVFILLTAYTVSQKPAISENFAALLCVAAAVAAVVSVPLWYSNHPFPDSRLVGMGTLDNPNPSSFAYGFFAVLCCHLALSQNNLFLRLVFSLSILLLVAFVFLTQSNTGILATVFSLALLLLLSHGGRLLHLSGGVIVAGGALLFLSHSIGFLDKPMDSGLSQRVPIWEKVIGQIEQAPLIGNGYQKQVLLDAQGAPDEANYAHSAILASFRDGGLVAAILHLLILATALVTAGGIYKRHKDPAYFAYLLFGFICMLADTDQLITRPRELWIIFWWPLAMIIASRTIQRTVEDDSRNKPVE